jgi:hypothetical protein
MFFIEAQKQIHANPEMKNGDIVVVSTANTNNNNNNNNTNIGDSKRKPRGHKRR